MRVIPKNIKRPLGFNQQPKEIQAVCNRLLGGLIEALGDNLYGIYLYGAMVFPETRYIQDIDFHVIVKRKLTDPEKQDIIKLHNEISEEFHILKDDLDGYYILLEDAGQIKTPWHQIYPDIPDDSWPLHIAHMRAGYCIVLYGPEPGTFLPEPAWQDLMKGLKSVMNHTVQNVEKYPAYCILNFCRLLNSYTTRDVVVSKRGACEWIVKNYPEWKELIESALRVFEKEERDGDRSNIESGTRKFHHFVIGKVKEINPDK